MRMFMIATAFVGLTAAAAPAQAQWYPYNGYGYGYNNGYNYNRYNNYDYTYGIERQIQQLRNEIRSATDQHRISYDQEQRLWRRLNDVSDMVYRYRSNGMSGYERQDVTARLNEIRDEIRGGNGWDQSWRDRDEDRYSNDRGRYDNDRADDDNDRYSGDDDRHSENGSRYRDDDIRNDDDRNDYDNGY